MRLNIHLDNYKASYLSGQTISGKLSMYNNERFKVKKIVIKLRGQAKVR